MDLWFSISEVWDIRPHAVAMVESVLQGAEAPFPREHQGCQRCDRELRLMCVAWAGIGIEAAGPARNYQPNFLDPATGRLQPPEFFTGTEAGRAAVWATRLIVAVGNHDMAAVAALTDEEMPELDRRAEALLRGVACLAAERRTLDELREIEADVLADMGASPIPPPPPVPFRWRISDWPG